MIFKNIDCIFIVFALSCLWDFRFVVILDIVDFDIILVKTWFSLYYVVFNCNTKSVTPGIREREKLEWKGVQA